MSMEATYNPDASPKKDGPSDETKGPSATLEHPHKDSDSNNQGIADYGQASKCASVAAELLAQGRSFIPLKKNSKKPATDEWKPYQTRLPTEVELQAWFANDYGLAFVTGNGIVVLDVDCKQDPKTGEYAKGYESLAALQAKHGPLPETRTVSTPSGGKHYYFKLPQGQELRNTTDLTTDLQGQELRHPGIDVRGDGGYVVHPPTVIDGRAYAVEKDVELAEAPAWLLKSAPEEPASSKTRTRSRKSYNDNPVILNDKQVKDLRRALPYIPADDRHEWMSVGMALKQCGQKGFDLWDEWSLTCPERYDEYENRQQWDSFKPSDTGFESVFKKAMSRGWENGPVPDANAEIDSEDDELDEWEEQESNFYFTRIGEIERKPMEFVVGDLIPFNSIGVLFGATQSGKSFLSIDWACCVAAGKPFWGRETKQGAVFYLAGEGEEGITKRVEAWCMENGVDHKELPFYLANTLPRMIDKSNAKKVFHNIRKIAESLDVVPRLIVIDTVQNALAGESYNQDGVVNQLMLNAKSLKRKWKATTLLVHHTNHNVSERAAGSGAFAQNSDFEYRMERTCPLSEPLRCQLVQTKAKDWKPLPHPIRFDSKKNEGLDTLVLVNSEQLSGQQYMQAVQEQMFQRQNADALLEQRIVDALLEGRPTSQIKKDLHVGHRRIETVKSRLIAEGKIANRRSK